jgi:hypothetical protein
MFKNSHYVFGFFIALGLTTQAFAQETQTLTFDDGESIIVSKKVIEAIKNLDYQAQQAGVTVPSEVESSVEVSDESKVAKKVVTQIVNIVNHRSLLTRAVAEDLGSNRWAAGATFVGAEAMQLALCTEFRGNDTGDCALNQGFNVGRRYVKNVVVDRLVDKVSLDGFADRKFEGKKGKANAFAKFILKNTDSALKLAGNLALNLGQNSLERKLGSERSTSFLQGRLLGTFDGVAYQALRSAQVLPGDKQE